MLDKNKIDFWKMFEDEGIIIEVDIPDFDEKITSSFVRNLRTDLDLTQKVFGNILGVTKKTIEKWEQGANPIKGPAARLLYLIEDNPILANKLYSVNITQSIDSLYGQSFKLKQITPLITEKSEHIYKLDNYSDQFITTTPNRFIIEGGDICQKKSNYPLSVS
jgi:transcriptional regulator with XRE-family HTH domain